MEKPASLRERKKAKTRNTVLDVARELFHANGFDATTIDEICEKSSISKRTFFRYFEDKEALIFPNRSQRLAYFVTFLDDSPPGESTFDTLRRATRMIAADYAENRDRIIAEQPLVASSAQLLAREREIDRDWEVEIVRTILARGPSGAAAELRARVLGGAMIGVIRATMRHWYEGQGREDLGRLGMEALDSLERGFPLEEEGD